MSIDIEFKIGLPELINNGSVSEVVSLLKRAEGAIKRAPEIPGLNQAVRKKLHGSARTTPEQRREIQESGLSQRELAAKYGIDPKTARKWKNRSSIEDEPMGPKTRGARKLTREQEDEIVRFYRDSGKSVDECLKHFGKKIPQLTRSAYYRSIQRVNRSVLDDKDPSLASALEMLIDRNGSPKRDVAIYVTGIRRG